MAAASSSSSSSLEQRVIDLFVNNDAKFGTGFDSLDLAAAWELDHQLIIGAVKALENEGYVVSDKKETSKWSLTPEGDQTLQNGSPALPEIPQ